MHKSTWTLSGYDILNPRSRDQDRTHITKLLYTISQCAPQTKSMGNQGKGAYGVASVLPGPIVDVLQMSYQSTTVKLVIKSLNLGNLKLRMLQGMTARKKKKRDYGEGIHESEKRISWVVILLKWLTVKGIEVASRRLWTVHRSR